MMNLYELVKDLDTFRTTRELIHEVKDLLIGQNFPTPLTFHFDDDVGNYIIDYETGEIVGSSECFVSLVPTDESVSCVFPTWRFILNQNKTLADGEIYLWDGQEPWRDER